ncbi:MAG: hypothetical protein WAN65_01615, partial [Candidatus Sulfotelmatobacter sp.]
MAAVSHDSVAVCKPVVDYVLSSGISAGLIQIRSCSQAEKDSSAETQPPAAKDLASMEAYLGKLRFKCKVIGQRSLLARPARGLSSLLDTQIGDVTVDYSYNVMAQLQESIS